LQAAGAGHSHVGQNGIELLNAKHFERLIRRCAASGVEFPDPQICLDQLAHIAIVIDN
jgi:hypothetical protein